MKKIIFFLGLLIILIVGVSLGSEDKATTAERINELASSFEDSITVPGNDYHSYESDLEPGLVNEVGRKIDNSISSVFNFSFKMLRSLLE